jgi:hypothetical protein
MNENENTTDAKALSPASDGSGSGLPGHLFAPEWRERARAFTFCGISVSELSRDELLSVVGYLAKQIEQERAAHDSTLGIMRAAATRLRK